MKSLKDVKAELLTNPAVRQAYDAQTPEFELARELIAARTQAGLTQGDVACEPAEPQSIAAPQGDLRVAIAVGTGEDDDGCAHGAGL